MLFLPKKTHRCFTRSHIRLSRELLKVTYLLPQASNYFFWQLKLFLNCTSRVGILFIVEEFYYSLLPRGQSFAVTVVAHMWKDDIRKYSRVCKKFFIPFYTPENMNTSLKFLIKVYVGLLKILRMSFRNWIWNIFLRNIVKQ